MSPKKPSRFPDPVHPPPPGPLPSPASGSPMQTDTPTRIPTAQEIANNLWRAHDGPVDWADTANRIGHGRPRIPWSWTKWPIHAHQTHGMPDGNAVSGLQNNSTLCYRNTVLQLLLNNRIFYNWAFKHVENSVWPCGRGRGSKRDCLVCSFAALATQYLQGVPPDVKPIATPDSEKPVDSDRDEGVLGKIGINGKEGTVDPLLVQRTDEFFYTCERVFWGPRARRRNKVGPVDMNRGSHHHVFLTWLLHYFREQVSHRPSEVQSLDLIFGGHGSKTSSCSNIKCELNSPPKDIKHPSLAQRDVSFNMIQPHDVSFEGGSIQDLLDDHFAKEYSFYTPCPLCTDCKRKGVINYRIMPIQPPEILLVYYHRRNGPADLTTDQAYRPIPVVQDITIPTTSKARAQYRLRSLILSQLNKGQDDIVQDGHLCAMVESRNRHWYICNDNMTKLSSLGEYDQHQADPTIDPRQKVLPSLFLYERVDRPHHGGDLSVLRDVRPDNKRLLASNDDDDVFDFTKRRRLADGYKPSGARQDDGSDQMIEDISSALSHIPRTRIREVFEHHGRKLAPTFEQLMTEGPKPPKADLFNNFESLDSLPIAMRPSILQIYAQMPQVPLLQIYDALNKNQDSVARALEVLQLRPKVSLDFVETVGEAEVTAKVEIAPCDVAGTRGADFESQDVIINVKYELAGKTWQGRLRGKTWKVNAANTSA